MKKIFSFFCVLYCISSLAGALKPDIAYAQLVSLEEYHHLKYEKLFADKALQAQMNHAEKLLKNSKTAYQGEQLLKVVETALGKYNPLADRILVNYYNEVKQTDKAKTLLGKLAIEGDPEAQFKLSSLMTDESLARRLLEKAAEPRVFEGDDDKRFVYSHIPAQHGLVLYKKPEEQIKLLEQMEQKALKGNNEKELRAIADLYFKREMVMPQKQTAPDFMKKGLTFLRRNSLFPSIRWKLIEKLATQENCEEMVEYLKKFEPNTITEEIAATLDLDLLSSSAQKNPEIAYQLYRIHKNGTTDNSTERDRALHYLKVAIDQNHVLALFDKFQKTNDENDRMSLAARIVAYASKKKEKEKFAHEQALKFLQENQKNLDALYGLAIEHAHLKESSKALQYLKEAAESPDYSKPNTIEAKAFKAVEGLSGESPQILKTLSSIRLKKVKQLKEGKEQAKELLEIQQMIYTMKKNNIAFDDDFLALLNGQLCSVASKLEQTDKEQVERLLTIAWKENNFFDAQMPWYKVRYKNEKETSKKKNIGSLWLTEAVKKGNPEIMFDACQETVELYVHHPEIINPELKEKISALLIDFVQQRPLDGLVLLDRWCAAESKNLSRQNLRVSLPDISSFPFQEQRIMKCLAQAANSNLGGSEALREMIESDTPEGYALAAWSEKDAQLQESYLVKFNDLFDKFQFKAPYAKNILARVFLAAHCNPRNSIYAQAGIKAALYYPIALNRPDSSRFLKYLHDDIDANALWAQKGLCAQAEHVWKVCDLFGESPEAFLLKGRLLFEQNDFCAAQKVLEKAKEFAHENDKSLIPFINKVLSNVLIEKARLIFKKERAMNEDVKSLLQEAIKCDPLSDKSIDFRGEIWQATNSYSMQEAIELMKLQADSGNPDAAYNLAKIYDWGAQFDLKNGEKVEIQPDKEMARKYCKIASENGHPEATRQCAALKILQGKRSEARELFEKAVMQGSEQAALDLGFELFNIGNVEEALKYIDKPFKDSQAYWRSNLFLATLHAVGRGVLQSNEEFINKIKNVFSRISHDLLLNEVNYTESDGALLKISINERFKTKDLIAKYSGEWKNYFEGHLKFIEAYFENDERKKLKAYKKCQEIFTKEAESQNENIKSHSLVQLAGMAYQAAREINEKNADAAINAKLYLVGAMELGKQGHESEILKMAMLLDTCLTNYWKEKLITTDFVSSFQTAYKKWADEQGFVIETRPLESSLKPQNNNTAMKQELT
jgi:TPR repeat protein